MWSWLHNSQIQICPLVPLSPIEIAIALTAIVAGVVVQGSVGFGAGLVAAPVLLIVDQDFVPGPMLAANLSIAVLMGWHEWRAIDWKGAGIALGGRSLGMFPAVLAFGALSATAFSCIFAALILLAVLLSLAGWTIRPTPRNTFLVGIVSGFPGTFASMGGPPMGLLYQNEPGSRIRATLAVFFVFGGILSLMALSLAGHFGKHQLLLAAVLLPGVFVGFLLSHFTAPLLDAQKTRPAVLIVSCLAALVVLGRAIW